MTGILAFFPGGAPGLPELIIFGTIALLLFGKRLPEVARSLGKGIVEFKKGVRCLLYTSPSPRDRTRSRMPSSA